MFSLTSINFGRGRDGAKKFGVGENNGKVSGEIIGIEVDGKFNLVNDATVMISDMKKAIFVFPKKIVKNGKHNSLVTFDDSSSLVIANGLITKRSHNGITYDIIERPDVFVLSKDFCQIQVLGCIGVSQQNDVRILCNVDNDLFDHEDFHLCKTKVLLYNDSGKNPAYAPSRGGDDYLYHGEDLVDNDDYGEQQPITNVKPLDGVNRSVFAERQVREPFGLKQEYAKAVKTSLEDVKPITEMPKINSFKEKKVKFSREFFNKSEVDENVDNTLYEEIKKATRLPELVPMKMVNGVEVKCTAEDLKKVVEWKREDYKSIFS